jgi:hypothetical protein
MKIFKDASKQWVFLPCPKIRKKLKRGPKIGHINLSLILLPLLVCRGSGTYEMLEREKGFAAYYPRKQNQNRGSSVIVSTKYKLSPAMVSPP